MTYNCNCCCCNADHEHNHVHKPHHFLWDDDCKNLDLLDAEEYDRIIGIIKRSIMDAENDFISRVGDFNVDQSLESTLSYSLITSLRGLLPTETESDDT